MELIEPFRRIDSPSNSLPESPHWSTGCLYWVDHGSQILHSFDWAAQRYSGETLDVSGNLRFVRTLPDGALLIGSETGLYRRSDGQLSPFGPTLPLIDATCINDGCVGQDGSIVIAVSDRAEAKPIGGFYRLEGEGWRSILPGISVANGPQDAGRSVYFSDSLAQKLLVAVDGCAPEVLLSFTTGLPDGLSIDGRDRLLVGLWGGSRVAVLDNGEVASEIPVPLPNVTCPLWFTVGGKGMLAVTACKDHDDPQNGLYVAEATV